MKYENSTPEFTGNNRRNFITKALMGGMGLALAPMAFANTDMGTKQSNSQDFTLDPTIDLKSHRRIGSLEVSSLGLGCMSMAGVYNEVKPKEAMISLIRSAYDKGITFFDTAEVYGPFISEEYVGEALSPFKGKVTIATKFGFNYEGNKSTGRNSKPEYIRERIEGSLKRLKVDTIGLFYLHRADPNVPIEDVAGAVKDLIQQGKVREFGVSEISAENIRKAHAVQPIAAVQSEYSIVERAVETTILPTCNELVISFVPWGPLSRGFLTGIYNENTKFDNRRAEVATFRPDAIKANMALLNVVKDWAKHKNVTPGQFSLAWLMAQNPRIVPIPGTTSLQHLEENMGAQNVQLTTADLVEFRTAISKIKLIGVRTPESMLQNQ